ncbi:hypothetical protein P368_19745 [Comamonas thiooxydans]|uniref:Uncharacterized protein n=1 Tax=Comamonas thiooxydans TaxID=363952 RepID=A0A096BVK0_9BURK|nr:hypothetical protein P245_22790 [Comamonas thiooxydans]KGG99111.1 hypothetical protein P365_22445 [Comamonas thiooxydans]KGH08263.1 hypothetical protein P368_19745 [Comamonas thiooxydans]
MFAEQGIPDLMGCTSATVAAETALWGDHS